MHNTDADSVACALSAGDNAGCAPTAGRSFPLPRSRRLVTDLLYFARQVPSQALVRHCNLQTLANRRRRPDGSSKVSWSALFLKAHGKLSARHAVLRQTYMPWPWPYVYEHPHPVARLSVARQYDGEEWVFFGSVDRPDGYTLAQLQQVLVQLQRAPVESIERFRHQLIVSRFPRVLRRLAWWSMLNGSPRVRCARFGTFGMTTVASYGAISVHPPSLYTTTLTFGPIDAAGNVRVTIAYDHRLMDGASVARFLEELEATLNGEIAEEVGSLDVCQAA